MIISIIQHGWQVVMSLANAGEALVVSYFLASLLIVPALIVLRRRYRRLSQKAQWALAGFAVVSTALAYTMIFAWQ